MTKRLLIATFTFCSLVAQAQIPGKKITGPVEVAGFKINEGDTLYFSQGTMPNGDFKYIYQPMNVFAGSPEYHMRRSFSGQWLVVKGLRNAESKRSGPKLLAIVNPGGFNSAVELEDAIKVGEISAINNQKVSSKTGAASTSSVADELIKLKQLLDAGALTQAEYDQQKKKLLDR